MVSETIRNRLLPLILNKLLDLEPGYTGSRISYRDSLRDSLDIDTLPEDYLNRSQEKSITVNFITTQTLYILTMWGKHWKNNQWPTKWNISRL